MHEMSAAQNILNLVLREAMRSHSTDVCRVSIKLGQWSTFEPDCLESCFRALARGTLAEDATLEFEILPVTFQCESCGFTYSPDSCTLGCPECSSDKGRLVGGRELYVEEIEVRNAGPTG